MLKEVILGQPLNYRIFQWLNGARIMRRTLPGEYIRVKDGDDVLDIACGTADILPYLGKVNYVGVDSSERYIDYDRKRWRRTGARFVCDDLNHFLAADAQKYDAILLMGVLHHINDEEARKCLRELLKHLKPDGRIVTMDGCFTEGLSGFERFLLKNDRGKFVRTLDEWRSLVQDCLPDAQYAIRKDLYYLPYNLIIFTIRQ